MCVQLAREPHPGAVAVTGLSQTASNGAYEPTTDMWSDMPIYRLKGSKIFSLQFVKDNLGATWRFLEADKPAHAFMVRGPSDDAGSTEQFLPMDEVVFPHSKESGGSSSSDDEHRKKITWLVAMNGVLGYSAPDVPVEVTLCNPDEDFPAALSEAQRVAQLSTDTFLEQKAIEVIYVL